MPPVCPTKLNGEIATGTLSSLSFGFADSACSTRLEIGGFIFKALATRKLRLRVSLVPLSRKAFYRSYEDARRRVAGTDLEPDLLSPPQGTGSLCKSARSYAYACCSGSGSDSDFKVLQ